MVVRARSLVAVLSGVAAFPLAAHAANPGPIQTPSLSCNSDNFVSGINWGDGSSTGVPAVQSQPGPVQTPFSCANNMYSAGVQGDSFVLNFGNLLPPPDPDLKYELKYELLSTSYKEMVVGTPDKWHTTTDFDMYISFYKEDVLQYKDFIGLKVDSMFGDALSPNNAFLVNEEGQLVLDPPLPGGGFAELELYNTPQVPEPGTLALVGTGLAGVAGVLRRKRKAKA
ncbi:MAG TPA: PEP-CTERM sorting domain-containing protein [Terriglobales bacterium]|nr:PEP-CTERM sorting domain-containing protein [Terriglobales bacterium]